MGSPPDTWQQVLDRLTDNVKSSDLFDVLKQYTSEEDLVKCLAVEPYTTELLDWINGVLNNTPWRKCNAKAKVCREMGNRDFGLRNFEESYKHYTKGTQYSPEGIAGEMAFCIANRSGCLFHLDFYQDSLIDINRAFRNGYPIHLHYKLYQRRARCYAKLGRFSESIDAYQLSISLLAKAKDMPDDKKEENRKAMEEAITSVKHCMNANHACHVEPIEDFGSYPLPSPDYGSNKELPSASKAVSLKESNGKGRFLVAERNIKAGDILFVEKPFAFVVLPEYCDQRCHFCCKKIKTPVPCSYCSIPLYCNEQCRDESWRKLHQLECHGGLSIAHAVGIAHLGLRVTLNAGTLQELKAFKNKPADPKNPYTAVYNLLTHLSDMTVEDRIAYTLTAICLMLYLAKYTRYFTSSAVNKTFQQCDDDHMFVGAIILRHICQLVCNGNAIVDFDLVAKTDALVEELKQVRVATAIYPSASMMNHSCDPDIINSFFDVNLIVKALKDIPRGCEITNCYGPNFRKMPRKDRQEALKAQYFFNCTCEKCSAPNEYSFKDQFRALKCPNCSGALVKIESVEWNFICLNCKRRPPTSQSRMIWVMAEAAHGLYESACDLLERDLLDDALREFEKCYDAQLQCLYTFNEEHRACLNQIAKCYAFAGDMVNSSYYLRRTLRAVSQQYGSCSIEMANELQTLTDVMLSDIIERISDTQPLKADCEIALQHVLKAKRILSLYYGPWTTALQDIIVKEERIRELIASSEG